MSSNNSRFDENKYSQLVKTDEKAKKAMEYMKQEPYYLRKKKEVKKNEQKGT